MLFFFYFSGTSVWIGIVLNFGGYAWINGTTFPPTNPFPALPTDTNDKALVIMTSQYRIEDRENDHEFLCDIVSNDVMEGELIRRNIGIKGL